MNIPPILTLHENRSLMEILQALALEEGALANLAEAEARKIHLLLRRLREFGCNTLSAEELAELRRYCSTVVAGSRSLQVVIKESLDSTLTALRLESVYDLCPLPEGVACRLSASGCGCICNCDDPFHTGHAHLTQADFFTAGDGVIEGSLRYRATAESLDQQLEIVNDGLSIDFVRPAYRGDYPTIALVCGWGVTRKQACCQDAERRLARFALTIWANGRTRKDLYRLLIFAGDGSWCNHDSGIIG